MKRILLLTTGGTIACLPTSQGLAPGLDAAAILERAPWLRTLCDITGRSILSLDSTNIQPEEWVIIAREVSASLPQYDGIVILHGTDTMAYTAAMLPFLLGPLEKPVILTGSQLPLTAPGSDAPENLTDAVRAALSGIRGVHVVFDRLIIQGTRAVKVQTVGRHAFESINAQPTGWIEQGQVRLAAAAATPAAETMPATPATSTAETMPATPWEPVAPAQVSSPSEPVAPAPAGSGIRLDSSVFLLKMIPGLRPEIFDRIIEMGFAGVVVEGFGMGGVPEYRRNVVTKLEQLVDAGMAVVLTTQCPFGKSDLAVYSAGWKAAAAGVIPGMDMTSEAALAKLMWVLGHTRDQKEIRRMMLTSYYGEIDQSSQAEMPVQPPAAADLEMAASTCVIPVAEMAAAGCSW